eukprot:3938345-Rhodomonas_salina.2
MMLSRIAFENMHLRARFRSDSASASSRANASLRHRAISRTALRFKQYVAPDSVSVQARRTDDAVGGPVGVVKVTEGRAEQREHRDVDVVEVVRVRAENERPAEGKPEGRDDEEDHEEKEGGGRLGERAREGRELAGDGAVLVEAHPHDDDDDA